MGLKGDLTAGEIVEQLVHARRVTTIKNVVYMVGFVPVNLNVISELPNICLRAATTDKPLNTEAQSTLALAACELCTDHLVHDLTQEPSCRAWASR